MMDSVGISLYNMMVLRGGKIRKYILNTSAVSWVSIGSILIFASCVIHLPLVCRTDVVTVNISSQLQ